MLAIKFYLCIYFTQKKYVEDLTAPMKDIVWNVH